MGGITQVMRRIGGALAVVAVVGLWPHPAAAQAPSSSAPSPRYEPLVRGWEQFFRVTWEPFERRGRPYLRGYIFNDGGFTAMRVQLLVEALDASGNVVKQTVHWGHQVPPGSRVYYEVPAPQAAPAYRVSMFAYDWLQTASLETP
jgi:hypothetical protein